MYGWYYPFMLPIIAIPMGILVLFLLENPEPKQNYDDDDTELTEPLCCWAGSSSKGPS